MILIKKYKNLLKNIFLFFISNLIPKAITFLLIPLYTKYLTTEEYGILDLITTTVSLMIPIITLNITDALLRFSLDKKIKSEDALNASFRIFFFDFLLSIIILLFMVIINPFGLNKIYSYFLSTQLIVNIFYNFCTIYLKGTERVNKIVVASVINSLLTLTIMYLTLVIMKMTVVGYVLGMTIGPAISSLYMIITSKIYKEISIKYDKKLLKEMIKYSFPMIFSAIAWWINNSSDRYIVAGILGVSVSGIYAVSSKIPAILKTFQNIFLQAWSISAIKEFDKNDTDGFIGRTFTIMNFLMLFLCSIIILLNIFVSKLMYSGDFYSAWVFAPPLLVAIIFDSLGLFLGSIFYAVKDTKSLSIANIIGALSNIILNLILINLFGAYGAAIATLLSYLLTFIITIVFLKKHISMKTNYCQNVIGYILIILQMALAYFGNKYFIIQAIILFALVFLYKNILHLVIKKIYELLFRRKKND